MKYWFDDIVVHSRTGLNPRKNFVLGTGDNKYVTIKNIHNNKLIFDKNTDIVDDDAINKIHKRSQIKKGDVLFASIGRLGDMYIIENEPYKWDINESVFAFTLNTKIIKQKYFYYMFKSENVMNYLTSNSSGSTFKSIKMNQLKRMQFNIPSINEQIKIINVLDSISTIIENQKSKVQLFDELVKARFVEMFEDDFKGNTHKLSEYTEVITKGTTPTTLGFSFTEEGINFVKIECISNEYTFIKDKMLHISEECNKKLKRSILKEGDILYSIAGAIGRTAIVSKDILPANTNQALAIIRLKEDAPLDKKFLNEMLHSDLVIKQSNDNIVAVAQANLSLTDIGNFDIVVPNIEKQIEYSRFVEQIDKSKFICQEKIKYYQELLDKQMNKCFGENN